MAGKTAILVDGGFYRKRARQLWGEKTPAETADGLFTYCKRHLSEHGRKHDLYRIFYYVARQSKSSYIIPCCNERRIFLGRRRVSG